MVLSGSSECDLDIFDRTFRDTPDGSRTKKEKALAVSSGFCISRSRRRDTRNDMYGRLLWRRCAYGLYFLFLPGTEVVVSGGTASYPLLGKCGAAGRIDVSDLPVWNGYRALSAGACLAGADPDLAVSRTAGISQQGVPAKLLRILSCPHADSCADIELCEFFLNTKYINITKAC